MTFQGTKRLSIGILAGVILWSGRTMAASLTIQTNALGASPELLGYNLGHFYPGSNTGDWWRYAGVTGARIFVSPTEIEPASSIQGAAALVGVSNQASFFACRAAMHTNQFNPAYINWLVMTNNYNNNDLYPVNHIKVSSALGALRKLKVQVCAQITASPSAFPIVDANDWAGLWGLWHHYYAQAFYLGREFDVQRYQIYNEPNNTGLTMGDFLLRVQFASDAVQAAIADVNWIYGKSLSPLILAPTLMGNAISAFPDWGELIVTNRHLNVLGQADPNFWLLQKYDYHQYGSPPADFGADLATLNADLQTAMAPEPPMPTTVSEFNTRTAASFDSTPNTLDTPVEYARFGAILTELVSNQCSELYCFKFSQVAYSGNYPVQKNALHYVDNTTPPYNIGGITRAGEVYRLFNKAFAPGRTRLNLQQGQSGQTAALEACASYDPVTQRYYLFSANTGSNQELNLDWSALNVWPGNRALLEEISETAYGGGVLWTNLPANAPLSLTQPANSVWLLTLPSRAQQDEQIVLTAADAEVRDGVNRSNNYGSAATMLARNDPSNTSNRRAALMKFHLPFVTVSNIELAVLSMQAATAASNTTAQAQVYLLSDTNWSPSTVTWSSAANLKQNVPAGAMLTNAVINGVGTNANIAGQIVVTSTNLAEKLIDVTECLRRQTNLDFSFLVVQDPRRNVTLPSLSPGDIQPDGVQIVASEGGIGPRLRLVLAAGSSNSSPAAFWTNLPVSTEAFIRGGAYADADQDEAGLGYLMVKYYAAPFDSARKAYFQFNLSGINLMAATQAVFTVNFLNSYKQNVQLWALDQPYQSFTSTVSWNQSQANETNSDNLLTSGTFTATAIGVPTNVPSSGTTLQSFLLPQIGDCIHSNLVTLALSGVSNMGAYTNDSGGLRIVPGSAVLRVLVSPMPRQPPQIAGITNQNVSITLSGIGVPKSTLWLQARTNLASGSWATISTNSADLNGGWTFTDWAATSLPARFYRVVAP